MAKGAEAKQRIVDKLAEVFGEDWIGEYEKKYYIWSRESGERVQVAISMTCPKVPIEVPGATKVEAEDNGDWDWSGTSSISIVSNDAVSAEITQEEISNLQTLLEKLGL